MCIFKAYMNFSQDSFSLLVRSGFIYEMCFRDYMKSSTFFLSFFMQVSLLIQFLIENCCRIFGEEITSLLGQVSVRCDTREKASGIVNNNWIGFCEKQACVSEDAGIGPGACRSSVKEASDLSHGPRVSAPPCMTS